MNELARIQRWRTLADRFRCTQVFLQRGRLAADYGPTDVIGLLEEALSSSERVIFTFLCHVWNRYDYPFELSEVVIFDDEHRQALADWITGKATGEPVHYF